MADKIFVDSNVWVYLFTSDEKEKNNRARQFIRDNGAGNVLVISYQVINEVSSVLKRKNFTEVQIRFVIETMSEMCVIRNFSLETVMSASLLRDKLSVSFWDSLIVASAGAMQCHLLVSEDMQDNRLINGMKIINIFNPR
ncbi:MAG: PIN domain-containing protein [Tannerella sp.]|jgi:predicted nucleic acid-binding protein|nr:PIN domain-containing protein [Tannerella sp.]